MKIQIGFLLGVAIFVTFILVRGCNNEIRHNRNIIPITNAELIPDSVNVVRVYEFMVCEDGGCISMRPGSTMEIRGDTMAMVRALGIAFYDLYTQYDSVVKATHR